MKTVFTAEYGARVEMQAFHLRGSLPHVFVMKNKVRSSKA